MENKNNIKATKKEIKSLTKEDFKQLVERTRMVRKYLRDEITLKELEDAGVRLAMPI